MSNREDVLLIYCSDGRGRKPNDTRGNINHAIRLPGGVLFPNLCANSLVRGEQTFEISSPIDLEIQKRINRLLELVTPETGIVVGELVVLEAAKAMVALKNPKRIILMSHTHCGAAQSLGLDDHAIRTIYTEWRRTLARAFPSTPIFVRHDKHCESGEQHHGHEDVFEIAA